MSFLDVLNQYDEKDPTSLSVGLREKINNQNKSAKSKLKIGVVEEAIIDISPEVRQAWLESLDYLRQLGHQISLVSIPSLKSALPTYFIVSPAEASSNLARYDGIRYGFRAESDSAGGVLFAPTRSDAFGPEVQRRILLGTYNLSAGAYGNHYEKAQRVRMKIRSEFDKVFAARNILERNEDSHCDGMDVLFIRRLGRLRRDMRLFAKSLL
jgi:aspartyl-tRNA(Asn)/glutamyl-tRNA(Gln) amidotransferase subunit A